MSSLRPRDERGSILIGGLVLVFVVTLVGAAIFGLAVSEPRLIADRQNKNLAGYTAGAGLDIAWLQLGGAAGNTFPTVWAAAAGTNIVPSAGGTQNLAPASGGKQTKYQVENCTGLLPASPTDWTNSCAAGTLPASQFAVRSHGTVVRVSDGATVGQAVVELVFNRTVNSVFNHGILTTSSSSMSGGGGIVDSWNSSQTYPGCSTAPCPYSSTVAGTGGDVFSDGDITFQSADTIKGSITAVGNITLDGSHITGNVWSGGSSGINGGGSSSAPGSISGNVTAGGSSTANFTGTGTFGGTASAGGTISSTETGCGSCKNPNMSPPPLAPTAIPYPSPNQLPAVQPCNLVGSSPGQYASGDPNRASSGYMTANYVASKLTASGAITVSSGVVKVGGSTVYTESTGVFTESGSVGTLTITAGTSPAVATFCFNTLTLSGGTTLALGSSVTSNNPVSIYLTDAAGKSNMSGGSLSNPTFDASRLQIYCSSTDTTKGIVLSGSSSAYMTIYAPATDVTLSGGSAMYGSVVSQTFEGTGGSDLHYDTNLGNTTNCTICPVTWTRVPNTWKLTVLQ